MPELFRQLQQYTPGMLKAGAEPLQEPSITQNTPLIVVLNELPSSLLHEQAVDETLQALNRKAVLCQALSQQCPVGKMPCLHFQIC